MRRPEGSGALALHAPLSKEQQNFNCLLAEVQKLRDSLTEWRGFADGRRQRVGLELVPLLARLILEGPRPRPG